jgi:hypothetical protein
VSGDLGSAKGIATPRRGWEKKTVRLAQPSAESRSKSHTRRNNSLEFEEVEKVEREMRAAIKEKASSLKLCGDSLDPG